MTARKLKDIEAEIDSHATLMRACFDELLERNAEARGKLQVRFTIAPDGSVPPPCIVSATLDDDTTAACITLLFEDMDFGHADRAVTVWYPVRFAAKPRGDPRWFHERGEEDLQLSRPVPALRP